jgi:hypothetical protein
MRAVGDGDLVVLIRNLELPSSLDAVALRGLARALRALSERLAVPSSAIDTSPIAVLVLRRSETRPLTRGADGVVVPIAVAAREVPTVLRPLLADVLTALHEVPVPTLAVLEGCVRPDELCLAAGCDVVTALAETRFARVAHESISTWSWPWAPELPSLSRRRALVTARPDAFVDDVGTEPHELAWARRLGLVDDVLRPPAITAATAVWVRSLAQSSPEVRRWLRHRSPEIADAEAWALLHPDDERESGVVAARTGTAPPRSDAAENAPDATGAG